MHRQKFRGHRLTQKNAQKKRKTSRQTTMAREDKDKRKREADRGRSSTVRRYPKKIPVEVHHNGRQKVALRLASKKCNDRCRR